MCFDFLFCLSKRKKSYSKTDDDYIKRFFVIYCQIGNLERLHRLLDNNLVDVHMKNEMGFREACSHGQLHIVKYLINNHRVNVHAIDEEGFRSACRNGQLRVVKYLLKQKNKKFKINIHAKFDDAFKWATYRNFLSVVKLLVRTDGNIFNFDFINILAASQTNHLIRKYFLHEISKILHEKNINTDEEGYNDEAPRDRREEDNILGEKEESRRDDDDLDIGKTDCKICFEKNHRLKIQTLAPICCNLNLLNDIYICNHCWKSMQNTCPFCRSELKSFYDTLYIHFYGQIQKV